MGLRSSSGFSGPELLCTRYWVTVDFPDSVRRIFTPEFMLYNGIVPRNWVLEHPVIFSSEFTEMVYDSGLTVQVDEDEAEFAMPVDGRPAAEVDVCNGVFLRCLEVLSELNPRVFSVGFKGYSIIPDGCPGIENIGVSLEDVLPIVSHRSLFVLPGREVRFSVQEVNRGGGGFIDSLDLELLTSYPADSTPLGEQLASVRSILERWDERFGEFVELATGFFSRHIRVP